LEAGEVTIMTGTSSGFTAFILWQLRCAGIRARLLTTEIASIDAALRGNFITTDDAIAWLDETALGLVVPSSITTVST